MERIDCCEFVVVVPSGWFSLGLTSILLNSKTRNKRSKIKYSNKKEYYWLLLFTTRQPLYKGKNRIQHLENLVPFCIWYFISYSAFWYSWKRNPFSSYTDTSNDSMMRGRWMLCFHVAISRETSSGSESLLLSIFLTSSGLLLLDGQLRGQFCILCIDLWQMALGAKIYWF